VSFAPLAAVKALAQATVSKRSPWKGMSYTRFVESIGVKLTRPQLALCLVAFDGLEPRDLRGDLRRHARAIFGNVDRIPARARRVLVAVCGARGGKTYTLGALRLLHLAVTVSLATMAPGERAVALIVAPSLKLAYQCLRYVSGAIGQSAELSACIVSDTAEAIVLDLPGGRVAIECVAASSGGLNLRGRSLVGVVLDECAFFRDGDYKVNDVELFRAAAPRVLPGGQTILCSTPWAESGLLYDEFVANHPSPQCAAPNCVTEGHPHRAMAAHAPTLLLRDNAPEIASVVESETERDSVNASREYGAKFLTIGTGLFFDSGAVGRCARAELVMPAARSPLSIPSVLSVGGDLGFTSDCATFVCIERTAAGVRLVDYVELKPTPTSGPLKPSVVYAAGVTVCKRWGVMHVVADQYYSQNAKEEFWKERIAFIETPGGQQGKGDMFTVTRRYVHEGRAELPNDARVLTQFREVQSRPTPGGGMSITQPRKGGHGDIVSAAVAATWHADRLPLPAAPEVLPDDAREAEGVRWERRISARIERDAQRSRGGFGGGVNYDVERDRGGWGRR
jgi:hypothetical protein